MKSTLLAAAIALFGTLLGTRWAISILVKHHYGQFIRDDGPNTHVTKRGTPTMGGIVIILVVDLAYVLAHLVFPIPEPTASGILVLGLVTALGFVGFIDDWIKISKSRSLGLHSYAKLALQTIVAVAFGILCFCFPDQRGLTPGSTAISFLRDIKWLNLPMWLAVIWIVFIVAAWSNAANLTDGLDGLASGSAAMVFAAYALIALWQQRQPCIGDRPAALCYSVRDPGDIALVALALAAACFGFLWWNAAPAKIFMGDTGSLALGGAIAGLSVVTRTELLMALVAGLFVIITLSVVLQVGYFKLTKAIFHLPQGKRLFKMAPLQHHFELLGWQEITIVIRFWIICGIFATLGVGIFYAEWTTGLGS
ncbi:MAG: phospho-N-acetylmuramoyl-pentapeptide-transferase [Propionibacteriaceae bacterium]|jgi:phospho-N-acetylmuramoyl-pentapeptide-transferase|nr:phospho-N-acetylmuramoyl-pentapeptide-transferase [Propionibacteriaceae bacterium]